ncbi:MAG: hypothetical protein E7515_02645 [Ruminococcaceae bacterium]|nr:hypothetical protein [Oscillospiraceae bacterium]
MSKGCFDGSMPRDVLEYYLSHASTAQWLYLSETLDDDIRAIVNAGVKFLGRASGIWKGEMPEDEHFEKSLALAEKVHKADPEIILQACIFEALYRDDVENVRIPRFVFEAFSLPFEERCFDFDKCVSGNAEGYGFHMPDISKTETQMWFYYRGVRYIDCGFEAFHMGQIHLYTFNDRGYKAIGKVIGMLREYGKKNARRHKVIFDAHSHLLVVNGKSLLDYNAMPLTRFPVLDRGGEKLVLVREGKSGGGISPEGVYEKALPFLYEYDNWGGRDEWAQENLTYEQRAWSQWWGGDQISWFAHQNEEDRNSFLDYTFKWTAINNPDAFFAFPVRRPLGSGEVVGKYPYYQFNTRSSSCENGYSQEATVKRLLEEGYEKYRKYANPSDILDFGGKDVDDSETGVRLPEKVVLYGSFQPYVGAVADDSNSEITRMYYIGDGKYSLSFIMPYKGEYDFAVSTWGTLSACVSPARPYAFSGTGGKAKLIIPEDNTVVKVTFTYMTNEVTTELIQ